MPSRRGWLSLALGVLCLGAIALPVSFSSGAPAGANENTQTLDLSLPGPFNGCSFLDPGFTASSNAILDLTRPSAFITNMNGTLEEGGAIASTELISLTPETVRYTIAPKLFWSDGLPFNGSDLVDWWQRAGPLSSVTSDGYRAIKSLGRLHQRALGDGRLPARPTPTGSSSFATSRRPARRRAVPSPSRVTRPSLGARTKSREGATASQRGARP